MSKSTALRDAMMGRREEESPAPAQAIRKASSDPNNPHYRPGRDGKANITGYFQPPVKRQLRILAAEQDTTIQALLEEAINDLFAKHGKPEIAGIAHE
ncbi:MAG: hypothetical protein OXC29_27695 [Rhodococcus sp.]|nr:hypothetical protein [Rhodococcus sp. (in: high G+C Gram-positive bacteria)]